MKAEQFRGKPILGVQRIPPQNVDLTATRGIKFDRPERYVVNTPFGQLELTAGDWVASYASGARYVFKNEDFVQHSETVFYAPWHVRFIRALRKWGLR